jgi:hypothetical protein
MLLNIVFLVGRLPKVPGRDVGGESKVFRERVRVTLQLTVSQSVSLGVEPSLGLLTRDLFFFF